MREAARYWMTKYYDCLGMIKITGDAFRGCRPRKVCCGAFPKVERVRLIFEQIYYEL